MPLCASWTLEHDLCIIFLLCCGCMCCTGITVFAVPCCAASEPNSLSLYFSLEILSCHLLLCRVLDLFQYWYQETKQCPFQKKKKKKIALHFTVSNSSKCLLIEFSSFGTSKNEWLLTCVLQRLKGAKLSNETCWKETDSSSKFLASLGRFWGRNQPLLEILYHLNCIVFCGSLLHSNVIISFYLAIKIILTKKEILQLILVN